MREHLHLGRIAGIPVGLNLTVLVIFALVVDLVATQTLPAAVHGSPQAAYWAVALLVGLLFFASLLAHELAHALVARRYGVHVERITLWMLGGVAQLVGEPPTPTADLRIAAAGPLTSVAAGAGFGALSVLSAGAGAPTVLTTGLVWLAGINVLLALFNLLPGAPLDGGRILRALMWRRNHDRTRAALAADQAGRVLGMLMLGLGTAELWLTSDAVGGLWLMLLGWFLVAAASGEAQMTRHHSLLAGVTVGAAMTPDPVCLPAYQTVERARAAALRDLHSSYPVVSFEGEPVGVVTSAQLTRLPPAVRAARRVGQVAFPLERLTTADPDELLPDVLDRTTGPLPVLVLDAGRLVGILTTRQIDQLLQRAALSGQTP